VTFATVGLLVAGAVAMAVPIIIHLLARRRRRPIEWAAMRFLIEALRKHRRRIRLEQILLLAARCAVLFILGAALARPILEQAGIFDTGGFRTVMLVMDNGLASGLQVAADDATTTTALERSVGQAIAVVKSLAPGDVVGLITAARPAQAVVVPPSSDHGAILELLEELEPSEASTDLHAALTMLQTTLDEHAQGRDRTVCYLFSEFRQGGAPLDVDLPSLRTALAPGDALLAAPAAQEVVGNIQVRSVESVRGLILTQAEEDSGQITVKLARSGGTLDRDVTRLRLVSGDLPLIEPKVVNWEPGQSETQVEFVVDLAGRGAEGLAISAVIDEDALGPDNRRHLALPARARLRVALVDRRHFGSTPNIDSLTAGQWIERALVPSDHSPMDIIAVDPVALEPLDLRGHDAAIVVRPDLLADEGWSVLRSFVDDGGLLVVMPPAESQVHQWTDILRRELDLPWQIALEASDHDPGLALAQEQPDSEVMRVIASELSMLARPVRASKVLAVDPRQTQAETLLSFADDTPMLIASSPLRRAAGDGEMPSRGLVIYMAVSPELGWTNLPAKPLMVPLLHELLRQGVGLIRTAERYGVGERPPLGLGRTAARISAPDGRVIDLDDSGRPQLALGRSGLYEVQDAAGQPMGRVAVNVNTEAGRPDTQPPTAIAEWLAKSGDWQTFDAVDPGRTLRTSASGAPLAGVLLWALLALVAVETVFARWFSHAEPGGRQGLAATGRPEQAAAVPGGLR
jgi:hypothetical protein